MFFKLFLLMLKNLRRHLLRTSLTAVATMVLVFVVILVWSILYFLDVVTQERAKDLKAIVTERWQIPSQMPFSYADSLSRGAASKPDDIVPDDSMTWQFYGGTLDPNKRTRENLIFFFAMEPKKLRTMMDDLDTLDPELIRKMEQNKRGVIVGQERLKALNKQVGERFTVSSLNYKGIDLEFEIVGVFPQGRYDQSAVMNRDYLNDALDDYYRKRGVRHPMHDRTLNLVWLKVPDSRAFARVAEQIMTSGLYTQPAVKCETAASGISTWLDAYRDLIWGMRWLLSPAVLVTMALVVANTISISVRERLTELAVMKVLGYRPWHLLVLVLGEALLVGGLSGAASAGLTFWVINHVFGGLKFPIAFFPEFLVPRASLWWGPVLGAATAVAGSILPAWTARAVRVSEVFAKVA
ncbi:MAG: ABC transporter permease [Gemmataceae bacterium]